MFNDITPFEAGQNVVNDTAVGMKSGDIAADVVVGFISWKGQFGLVSIENALVGIDDMQSRRLPYRAL